IRQPPRRMDRDHPRHRDEDGRVALDLLVHAGTEHLDRDLRPVLQAPAMHLRHRRRRDRRLLERGEVLLEPPAQLGLDDLAHAGEGEGRHPVLELAQLVDHLGVEQVGSRRQHLPELHEAGAERGEQAAQHASAKVRDRAPPIAREQQRQPAERIARREPADEEAHDDEAAEIPQSISPFLYPSSSFCTLSRIWFVSSSSLVRARICVASRSRSRASLSSISWYFTCTVASSVTLRCTSSAPIVLPAWSEIGMADRMKRISPCSPPGIVPLISSNLTCRLSRQHWCAMHCSLQMLSSSTS